MPETDTGIMNVATSNIKPDDLLLVLLQLEPNRLGSGEEPSPSTTVP